MADDVQEQMGDILSAFGIPELADDIYPIPAQPLHTESDEVAEAQTKPGINPDDKDDSMGDDASDDKLSEDEEAAMDTEDTASTSNSKSELADDNPQPTQGDITMKQVTSDADTPPAQNRHDLGLTQSVAPVMGKSEPSLVRHLLTSTSTPVMTPLPQGRLPQPQGQVDSGQQSSSMGADEMADPHDNSDEDSLSPRMPSTLTSMEEFNTYFDRCKEARELLQMKESLLEKSSSLGSYRCPQLSDEQALALNMNKETFQCPGCNDTFLFKASLDAHVERKTVLITFFCQGCTGRQNLVFYNRCNFLAHLHRHSATDEEIEAVKLQATVTPVSAVDSLKIFTKLTGPKKKASAKTPFSQSSIKAFQRSNPPVTALKQPLQPTIKTSKASAQPSPEEISSDSDDNDDAREPKVTPPPTKKATTLVQTVVTPESPKWNNYACIGCGKRFSKKEHLRSHLQAIYPKAPLHQCPTCKMVLNNACKVAMHDTVHRDKGNYPCPDCGSNFRDLKALLIHENNDCLHWLRKPLFKCAFCSKYATSFVGLVRHFVSSHIDIFFKCTLCQLAFRNNEAAVEHSMQVHRDKGRSYGLLYKCPFCKSVYSESKMLENHFETHFKTGDIEIEKFVHSCFMCAKPFDHSRAIRTHVQTAHRKPHVKIFNCDICHLTFADIGFVLAHRVNCQSRALHPGQSSSKLVSNMVNRPDPIKNQPPSKSPASQGSTSPRSQKIFMCGECGEKFPDYSIEALRNHMVEKHTAQIRTERSNKGPNVSPSVSVQTKPSKEAVATGGSVTQPKPTGTSQKPLENKEESMRVERFTDLQCAKCEHKSTDRVEFEKHIVIHKTEEVYSQCHECGLCFRIQDSLRKHLFIKHKIKDVAVFQKMCMELVRKTREEEKRKKLEEEAKNKEREQEEKKETTEANPSDEQGASPSPRAEQCAEDADDQLRCKVCKAKFDNDKTFAVHIRSHGLAYLQHQLSTKSPEKAARLSEVKVAVAPDLAAKTPDEKGTLTSDVRAEMTNPLSEEENDGTLAQN